MNSTVNDNCLISKALDNFAFRPCKNENDPFEFRLTNSVRIFKTDWDCLVDVHNILHSSFCQLYEHSSPANIEYRYAIVYENKKPVLCAVFQLVCVKSDFIHIPFENDFLKLATQFLLNVHDTKLLVAGNVFREDLNSYYFSLLSPTKTEQILTKLSDMISTQECTSGTLWKDMPDNFQAEPKAIRLEDDISMKMEIQSNWRNLIDYQQDLSKKYAARAKKIIASASDLKAKEFTLHEIESNKKELHFLYLQVAKRQPFLFGILQDDYLVQMKMLHGDSFTVQGFYLDEKLVAFISSFSLPEEWQVHYIGIDYTYNVSHNIYFFLHFFALQEAIVQNKKWLHMGRTSLEAKAILGCEPIYNRSYIKFSNTLAEHAFHYLKKNIQETDKWKTRNPLKTKETITLGG